MGGSVQTKRLIFSDKQLEVVKRLESPNYSNITEIFYGGAAGGGKTFLIAHWMIERRLFFPGTRGLIGRASLKNLKLTTFKTFCDVWHEYYRNNPMQTTWKLNNQTNVITFTNGSEILLMDLAHAPSDPEYHSLGSLELTDVAVDELPEITKKCWEILQSRIRYRLEDVGGVPKALGTGNPANNWVKTRYVKGEEQEDVKLLNHQAYIRATVHDNPNEEFKKTYISALKKLSPADRLRLLEGQWDIMLNENPWAWGLNRTKHYVPEKYQLNHNYTLDFSFDFNADPSTVVVGQVEHHIPRYNIIGAHKASSGDKSALEALCDILKKEYPEHISKGNVIVTGDSTGKSRDASRPSNINRYTEICEHLNIGNRSVMIEKANIAHKASRDLCNSALHEIPKGGLIFWSGRGCEILLSDIEGAFPDQNESLVKYKKDHGGHMLDCWRYLLKLWFAHKMNGANFKNYQRNIEGVKMRLKKVIEIY